MVGCLSVCCGFVSSISCCRFQDGCFGLLVFGRFDACLAETTETAVKHVAVAGSLLTAERVVEAARPATTPRFKNAADMFTSMKEVYGEVSLHF